MRHKGRIRRFAAALCLFFVAVGLRAQTKQMKVATAFSVSVAIGTYDADSEGYPATLRQGNKALYRFNLTDYPVALVAPRHRLFLTSAFKEGWVIQARDYAGRERWRTPVPFVIGTRGYLGGGDYAVAFDKPPAWGVSGEPVESWPDVYHSERFAILSLKDGRVVRVAREDEFGRPVWTNGSIVAMERLDLSTAAIRRAAAGKERIPVWLEVRSLRTFRLLWRRQIPGFVSEGPETGRAATAAAQPTKSGRNARLTFRFDKFIWYERKCGVGWPRFLDEYTTEIPLFGSRVEPAALVPVEYGGRE